MNPRTVVRCMKELAQEKLVEISKQVIGRGQPQIFYSLCPENICFAVLTLMPSDIYAFICDVKGFPKYMFHKEYRSSELRKNLPGLLSPVIQEIIRNSQKKGGKLYSIAVNNALDDACMDKLENKVSEMLSPFCLDGCLCRHANEFLLSQYTINNHLTGKVLGLVYNGFKYFHQIAVSDSKIDRSAALRMTRILEESTDSCHGFRLLDLLDFDFYVKEFSPELYSTCSKTTTLCYNEVYSRALNGDAKAEKILRNYGALLAQSICLLKERLDFSTIILMHSRPIIIEAVLTELARRKVKIPLQTANFSSNEFLLAPVGYLRRELFPFEHGKIL